MDLLSLYVLSECLLNTTRSTLLDIDMDQVRNDLTIYTLYVIDVVCLCYSNTTRIRRSSFVVAKLNYVSFIVTRLR